MIGEFALLHLSIETQANDVRAFFSDVADYILIHSRRVLIVIDGRDIAYGLDCADGNLVAIIGDKSYTLKNSNVFIIEFGVPLIGKATRRASPIVIEATLADGHRVRLRRASLWRYFYGLHLCHRCDY